MAVEGLARLDRTFRRLGPAAGRTVFKALHRSGTEFVPVAKALVPRDREDLAESIKFDVLRLPGDSGAVMLARAGYAPDDPSTHAALGARQQEFSRAPSRGHPGHDAQPFMFPAYRTLRKRFKARMKRAFRKIAKDAR